ncbi:CopD family protein [uncultured Jannaschia sp.]|uniref:CopD family protein n=1 Tax=uncultured Jannaschia sp. TaxID=293347 RepID=UPI0026397DB4|nr:CopD family protein [uncultured Jannaschia sp.]
MLWAAFLAPGEGRRIRPVVAVAALVGLSLIALRLGLRGAGLTGDWDGFTDTDMIGLLLETSVAAVAGWRAAGFGLLAVWALVPRLGHAPGLAGAAALIWSFTVVGHVSELPRDWATATLVHLGMVALWMAALLTLRRLARAGDPAAGPAAERFGRVAIWAVAALVLAGLALGWRLLGGGFAPLVTTAYGWTLLAKLAVVAGLLGLAALNKLRLSPALAAGDPTAGRRLARSIEWEVAAVAVILTLTAVLTIVTALPTVA